MATFQDSFHRNQDLCTESCHFFSTWCCLNKCGVSSADGRTVRHLSLVFCYLLSLVAVFVICILYAPFHFPLLFLFKICCRKCNWIICISLPTERETFRLGAGEKRGNGSNNNIGKCAGIGVTLMSGRHVSWFETVTKVTSSLSLWAK